jgi:hypothetical protein
MLCMYIMEYYSAIKKNEIMPFAGERWMELEIIKLSQIRPTYKDKSSVFSLICGF